MQTYGARFSKLPHGHAKVERYWLFLLVGNDGKVYEGRGWGVVGAHARGVNSRSVGIAFIGDFTKIQPSPAAINSARELIEEGVRKGKISKNHRVRGHRDVNSTTCPGDRLYATIKKWPKYGR
ncbi:hypothetical protein AHF37_00527 [Paragonimus kellicotti]|nr:hypothetical protein AHF37_00527 [Paragonimus kellicotti]